MIFPNFGEAHEPMSHDSHNGCSGNSIFIYMSPHTCKCRKSVMKTHKKGFHQTFSINFSTESIYIFLWNFWGFSLTVLCFYYQFFIVIFRTFWIFFCVFTISGEEVWSLSSQEDSCELCLTGQAVRDLVSHTHTHPKNVDKHTSLPVKHCTQCHHYPLKVLTNEPY